MSAETSNSANTQGYNGRVVQVTDTYSEGLENLKSMGFELGTRQTTDFGDFSVTYVRAEYGDEEYLLAAMEAGEETDQQFFVHYRPEAVRGLSIAGANSDTPKEFLKETTEEDLDKFLTP